MFTPVVEIYCLPKLKQSQYERLFRAVVATMTQLKIPNLESKDDMLTLMPADLMEYGLGTEIFIRVTLPHNFGTKLRRNEISKEVGETVAKQLAIKTPRKAKPHVFCLVRHVDPDNDGTWSSKAPKRRRHKLVRMSRRPATLDDLRGAKTRGTKVPFSGPIAIGPGGRRGLVLSRRS